MHFQIRESYNFDLINMLNILTGDVSYTKLHPQAYSEFGEALSEESRDILHMITEALGNAMISPLINFVLSFIPDFEEVDLLDLLMDEPRILDGVQKSDPRMLPKTQEMMPLLRSILPVLAELENMGFRDYWINEWLPRIDQKKKELTSFVQQSNSNEKISAMFGMEYAPEEVTLYLCAFASPHGIKVFGTRYIADISYPLETIFMIAIHEIFHPPYDFVQVQHVLDQIAADPFIKLAFEKTDPQYGYIEMESFLEENVVEAMALFIAQQTGLELDPFGYLLKHDGGSHVFSVILLDWMKHNPKNETQQFADYFRALVEKMPIGKLVGAYQSALKNAGKELTF